MNSKEVKLPSGATLTITLAPFADGKALYQAVVAEAVNVKLDRNAEVYDMLKNIICLGLASKNIEMAIEKCMEKALYNKGKITPDTFEPEANRDDYLAVCFEVARANISPFVKSLYAQYKPFLDALKEKVHA